MGTVKLAAALPKEPELNGLMDHAHLLLRNAGDEYLIVARVGVSQIIEDRWKGIRIPVLGVVAVELAVDIDGAVDEELARNIMSRAKDRRYARTPMPWPRGTLGSQE